MEIPVETTVVAAVVYPDRARVVNRGQCVLAEGSHQIIIDELPLALESESVRAAGQGTARVRLRSVDVRRRHYVQTPSESAAALEKEIERISAALQALDDNAAVKQASIDHLNGMRNATENYAWGLARGRVTVENQAALMRFFEDEDIRLRADLRELGEAQHDHQNELAKLRAELEQIRSARPRQRYEARLEVEALSPGDFTVELTYVVGQAGWQPLYDMRLHESDEGTLLTITSQAEITQNTGQNWSDVQLSVSTARPALNQLVPETEPWYVDEYRPPQPQPRERDLIGVAKMSQMDAANMGMTGGFASAVAAMMAPAPVEAEADVATLQQSGTAVTFAVSGSVDVPGDGTPKKLTIGQSDLPPQLDFLSVPRHTDAVYRRATLTNTTGAPMLPGPASLYVNDEYIGRNHLEYTPSGGEVKLTLGVEERITVKRELVRRDVDKRLLRDQRQLVYGYEIKLENLLATPARILVEDQYPVSRHDQIKVRLDQASPEPMERSDLHILKWQIDLAPAEKKVIRFEYQVEHPRGMVINGLVD